MDVSLFRTNFPEFSDTVIYPNALITFWSTVAEMQLCKDVWCDMWTLATYLYTAHEITIAMQNQKAAAVGGVPGTSGGIANTKTVGQVSVGYDSQAQSEAGAGWWNRTLYGQQLFRLIQLFGARAIQL